MNPPILRIADTAIRFTFWSNVYLRVSEWQLITRHLRTVPVRSKVDEPFAAVMACKIHAGQLASTREIHTVAEVGIDVRDRLAVQVERRLCMPSKADNRDLNRRAFKHPLATGPSIEHRRRSHDSIHDLPVELTSDRLRREQPGPDGRPRLDCAACTFEPVAAQIAGV